MLLRTLFLVALIAVLSETIVYGAGAMARMSFHAKELSAVRAAFAGGIAQAQSAAISHTIPLPSATCAYADEHNCQISIKTTISVPTPIPGATPSSCANAACTIYTQENTHVSESRVSYAIQEDVLAGNGDVMMSRRGVVAFRTFATAPYAALVGSLDQTLDALANGGTGDDGGSASTAASTLIHVEYQQSGGGSRSPGDVWRSQDEHPATAAPSWDS